MTDQAKPRSAAKAVEATAADKGGQGRVLLVTGLSGAGKSSVLKGLEDLGYEAVDNLPLSLLVGLFRPGGDVRRPVAIGIDIRTRDFAVEPFLHEIESLMARDDLDLRLVFVDCDDEVLRRRFTATRRRHPLASDRPVTDGIAHERRVVSPLRHRADVVIDTTSLTLGDLRHLVEDHFGLDSQPALAIFVISFSYGHGLPREADLVFDVRFLANPYHDPDLSPLTGRDQAVGAYIAADSGFAPFFQGLTDMLAALLPRFVREGKSYLTIAIGCTGGHHRSVFVAEKLARWLTEEGQSVSLRHRDLERILTG